MPRFAANLSFLYNDVAFLERFGAAAASGFAGVEYLFPYAWDVQTLRELLQRHRLAQVLFNAPPGGLDRGAMASAWDRGDRGTAALAGREDEFRAGVTMALEYAAALHCPRVHVMAGLLSVDADRAAARRAYVANLRWAAEHAHDAGVTLLIEPINTRDMPGYFLNRQEEAHAIVQEVASPALQVQMDLYHCQVMEGDLLMRLQQWLPTGRVGHLQVAGVPERHEPDTGEVNYTYLFERIDAMGYTGWIGCEYRPRAGTVPQATQQGLGWAAPWLAHG